MSDTIIEIDGYADLAASTDVSSRDADRIAYELQAHPDPEKYLVAWAPRWLVEEKDVAPVDGSDHVLAGPLSYESEKAFLIEPDGDECWLPKSVVTVYRAAPDAEISIPQHSISDYGGSP